MGNLVKILEDENELFILYESSLFKIHEKITIDQIEIEKDYIYIESENALITINLTNADIEEYDKGFNIFLSSEKINIEVV